MRDTASTPVRRAWYRSLYSRIAAGFVLFLGATLAIQAALFVWIVIRGEGEVSSRALEGYASLVANDAAAEIAANRTATLGRHLTDRYGSLPRPTWLVFPDGSVVSGKWGPAPPGLVRAAIDRLEGRLPPRRFEQQPPPPPDLRDPFRPRRRPAFAPVVVGGRPVAMVVAVAGRPLQTIAEEMGPLLLLMAIGLVVGAGALAAVLVFRPAHRRLEGLIEAARRLGAGDPIARAPEAGGDEISGVAHAFNQMADDLAGRAAALQASDRARRQLLADVSHELMTPLTAIRGYLETLGMSGLKLSEESRRRYLKIVSEETLRLERLIGDLLDLSRFEAGGGTLSLEPVAVCDLFTRVEDRHRPAASERQVTIDTSAPDDLYVQADRIRLEQALQNLAANALRHTPPSGRVQLTAARRDGTVVIRVRDTGEGIPPEHLPHVFDRFYKADASRAETPGSGSGSGLGLSIVKAIVERHGGQITASSIPGHETIFELTLPGATGPTPARA